jgi:hypothetical protein
MMTTLAAISTPTTFTRTLLISAAVAAPLWAAVSLAQAATRAGFDLTRHPLSILSNGELGWLQIANFLVGGALTVIGSFGLSHVLTSVWAPRLVLVNGVGMMAAGVFVMDPGDGFPVGTPALTSLSWHSYGHMAAGTVAFAALISACYVLGRHFGRAGERAWSIGSWVAGSALLLGDGWAMAGAPAGSLTLAVGAIAAMLWISVVAGRYLSGATTAQR